jgi:hypothetical protein
MVLALVAATVLHSGVYGTVVIDPAFPVCQVGTPCSKPAPGLRLAFTQRGRVVARTTTRADGTYRVTLAAGRYSVSTARKTQTIGRGLEPRTVSVPRARYRRVDFRLDIGIR